MRKILISLLQNLEQKTHQTKIGRKIPTRIRNRNCSMAKGNSSKFLCMLDFQYDPRIPEAKAPRKLIIAFIKQHCLDENGNCAIQIVGLETTNSFLVQEIHKYVVQQKAFKAKSRWKRAGNAVRTINKFQDNRRRMSDRRKDLLRQNELDEMKWLTDTFLGRFCSKSCCCLVKKGRPVRSGLFLVSDLTNIVVQENYSQNCNWMESIHIQTF